MEPGSVRWARSDKERLKVYKTETSSTNWQRIRLEHPAAPLPQWGNKFCRMAVLPMAVSITNFNQQASDRQQAMIAQMRTQCPGTAALSDGVMAKPASSTRPGLEGMIEADQRQAQNSQALTNLLLGACNAERAEGGYPPFMTR